MDTPLTGPKTIELDSGPCYTQPAMSDQYQVLIHDSIQSFERSQWNALDPEQSPFTSYEFFEALEFGKCVKETSGWHPLYFGVFQENNQQKNLVNALVAYIKTDSYGEFIFDWEWARAYQQYGLPYYPKLTVAVPYSPISAPKIIGEDREGIKLILSSLFDFYQKESLTGLHVLFAQDCESKQFEEIGLKERHSFQYHWLINEAKTFEDYLASLRKNRRKSIKRERKSIKENTQLSFKRLSGSEITSKEIDFFYECYLTTIDKKWSQAYLSHDFFKKLIESRGQDVFLVMAYEDDSPIACALYLKSNKALFGRYWGAKKEIEFLHFELCIYQGIELSLALGLKRFEAGAQGEHKRMRGFRPVITKSFHHLKEPQFFAAVTQFLEKEKNAISQWLKEFEKESPLKEERAKSLQSNPKE